MALHTLDQSTVGTEPIVVQVYKGILRSTGESVAVKVQRPGIGDHIAIDMLLLRRLMGVIDKNQTVVRPLGSCVQLQQSRRYHCFHCLLIAA